MDRGAIPPFARPGDSAGNLSAQFIGREAGYFAHTGHTGRQVTPVVFFAFTQRGYDPDSGDHDNRATHMVFCRLIH